MGIFGFGSCGPVIEAESEVVKDGGNNRPLPVCHICEIEIKEHEETDFIIVVGDSETCGLDVGVI
jgi:hypothetical protein